MDENRLGQLGIIFSSKVSASISHELNNVLAVIRESSGLLQDYLAILAQGGDLNTSVLERVSQRLDNQVGRGQGIVARMNRFAHSGDHPKAEIDLTETVGLVVDLQHRLAVRDGAEFILGPAEKVPLTTKPFLLEDILWRALCFAAPLAGPARPCPVRVSGNSDGATVAIGGLDFSKADPGLVFPGPDEEFLMALLNGSLEVDREKGEINAAFKNV